MAAIMWVDRDRRFFISTASSTAPSDIHTRTRWRQTNEGAQIIDVPFTQPKAVELYYSVCSKIDEHNRRRQDDLNIEKKLQTKSWAFRVNSTLLSMIVVDSWLVYDGCLGTVTHLAQKEFYEALATELINMNQGHGPAIAGTGGSTSSGL